MSKSKGNFFTLKELTSKYGADVVRFTLCNAGEGLDDPNWEISFAETAGKKLKNWLSFVKKNKGKGRTTTHPIDTWFREIMASIAHQANVASERLKLEPPLVSFSLNSLNISNGTSKELTNHT